MKTILINDTFINLEQMQTIQTHPWGKADNLIFYPIGWDPAHHISVEVPKGEGQLWLKKIQEICQKSS